VIELVKYLDLRYTIHGEATMFPKQYKYCIGIGLMLFGFFAVYFKEYDHPIYGYINLGDYHILIGIASSIIGAIYTAYVRFNHK
jgi:hypothetical protein